MTATSLASQQQWLEDSMARRDDGQMEQRAERRSAREARLYGDSQPQNGPPANAAPDENRKSGRMTPEERRELRRQINEAGRNIYVPGR